MNRQERRKLKSLAKSAGPVETGSEAAWCLREANSHLKTARFKEAEAGFRAILECDPQHPMALHHLGRARFKMGFKAEAAQLIRQSLRVCPEDSKAWLNLAVILSNLGDHAEALDACEKCLALNDRAPESFKTKGDILRALGQHTASADAYSAALALDPNSETLHLSLSKSLWRCGDPVGSASHCARALDINPNFREAIAFLSELSQCEHKHGAPLRDLNTESVLREANALRSKGSINDALNILNQAVDAGADDPKLYFALAALYDDIGRTADAFAACKTALDRSPDEAAGYAHAGLLLRKLKMYEGAIAAFSEAVRREPSLLSARHNLAVTYRVLGRFEEAKENFQAIISKDSTALLSRIELAYTRRLVCDWDGLEQEELRCLEQLRSSTAVIPPFVLLAMPAGPGDHLEMGRRYAADQAMPRSLRFKHDRHRLGSSGRIRLGYLSTDFNDHPTSLLLTEIFELHDRTRFEVIGYSIGFDDGSERRRRVIAACDRFVEMEHLPHQASARKIFDDGVDILIDLNGFTRYSRPEIASLRPAPIQVNFLGYPSTMGGDFMDYFVADAVCVPPGAEAGFSEKVVRLPGCYQPNDRRRSISPDCPTRAEAGLPDGAFVFCCFNGSWKINEAMFDVWMRLLRHTPQSVLWLLAQNDITRRNLISAAQSRGVASERLVFAAKMPNDRHLARHALADLFLDCIPCNAHTTASDALWAGLPLVTCTGDTFASRVAASLLYAVELPELVAATLEQYENIALSLAQNPTRLKLMRDHLLSKKGQLSLFDSQTYTRHLESAYADMRSEYLMR